MARTTLIFMALILTSCQSTQQVRLDAAVTSKARSEAQIERPETPQSCKAKVNRIVPKVGDKWSHIQKQWELSADIRDQQSDDCAQILDQYWQSVGTTDGSTKN